MRSRPELRHAWQEKGQILNWFQPILALAESVVPGNRTPWGGHHHIPGLGVDDLAVRTRDLAEDPGGVRRVTGFGQSGSRPIGIARTTTAKASTTRKTRVLRLGGVSSRT